MCVIANYQPNALLHTFFSNCAELLIVFICRWMILTKEQIDLEIIT